MYQVSNFGRIKSLARFRFGIRGEYLQSERIIKPNVEHNRYPRVTLYKDRRPHYLSIHRLVAAAFIPNASNKPQVNHIDNDSQNNNVNNLEWVTVSENAKHAYKIGASKPPMINKRHSAETKEKISENRKNIKPFNAAFSDSEAREIVKSKLAGESRKSVWEKYKHKITKGGFQNIWYRRSYKSIWREIS